LNRIFCGIEVGSSRLTRGSDDGGLTFPRDQDLLDAIQQAFQCNSAARAQQAEIHDLQERYHALTSREREVMTLVVSGMLNKQIVSEIGASEATVKIHRGHVMQKAGPVIPTLFQF
jgi:FixJ family two-component response regulator